MDPEDLTENDLRCIQVYKEHLEPMLDKIEQIEGAQSREEAESALISHIADSAKQRYKKGILKSFVANLQVCLWHTTDQF